MMHPALPRIESGLAAMRAALVEGDLDTLHARLVEVLELVAGQAVTCVAGHRLNIKLTTPEDLVLAQALLPRLQS